MTLPWIKLYLSLAEDAKVRELDDGEFRVLIHLLLLAGKAEKRGSYHFSGSRSDKAAFGKPVAEVDAALAIIAELGIITIEDVADAGSATGNTLKKVIHICNWEDYQGDVAVENSRANARTRKQRQRDRARDMSVTDKPVTCDDDGRHTDVTPMSHRCHTMSRSRIR
jgi:hypothetical protein